MSIVKRMIKKSVSLLLSAAMVVTGGNVTTNAAKAYDTKSKLVASWEGSMSLEKGKKDMGGWEVDTYTSQVTTTATTGAVNAFGVGITTWESDYHEYWGGANVNYGVELDKYEKISVKITGTADEDSFVSVTTNSTIKDPATVDVTKGDFVKTVEFVPSETSIISVAISDKNPSVTLKKVEIFGETTEEPSEEPSATAAGPSTEPEDPNYQVPEAEGYKAFLMFASSDWSVSNMDTDANGNDAIVTGNGTYTVSFDLEESQAVEAVQVFCVDIKGLANAQNLDVSNMSIKDVIVKCDDEVVDTDMSKMYFGCIEGEGSMRLEIYNAWGFSNEENQNNFTTAEEVDPESFAFTKSISVTFTLDGIRKGATPTESSYKIKTATGEIVGAAKRKTPKTPKPETPEPIESAGSSQSPLPDRKETVQPAAVTTFPAIKETAKPRKTAIQMPNVSPSSRTATPKPTSTPKNTAKPLGTGKPKATVAPVIKDLKASVFYQKKNGYLYKKAVRLSWTQTERMAGCIIYRRTGNSGKEKAIDAIDYGNSGNYTDKTVKPGTTYVYRVLCYNINDDGEVFQEVYSNKAAAAVGKSMKKPKISVKVSRKYMTLYFKQVEGDQYELQYRWGKGEKWKGASNLKGRVHKKVKRRINAKGFMMRTRSYSVVNGKKIYSQWSASRNIK